MSTDLRARILAALREHQPPTHVDSEGLPPDEFECCADAVMTVLAGADTEPRCSECGGRPKRGLIRSEDGETWQCEGCYADLTREFPPGGDDR